MGRKKSNHVYRYFDLKEDGNSECLLCNKILKGQHGANLLAHLKTHKPEYEETRRLNEEAKEAKRPRLSVKVKSEDPDQDDAEDDSDNDNRLDETQQGSEKDIRSVFDKLTGGKARCTLCLSSVGYHDNDMKRHLKSRHPTKYAEICGESNSNDEEEDIFKDVVYLEESFTQPIPNTSKSAKRPIARRYSTKPRFNFHETTVHTPSVSTPKKTQQEEEIEKFATYITHLLKTVTPEQCSKLQMEIINLIMREKLKKPEAPVQAPQYIVQHMNGEVIVKSTDAEVEVAEMEGDAGSGDVNGELTTSG